MMTKAKKILLSIATLMVVMISSMWLSTTEAAAASVSISGVPSSVTKGQSFTVTATYYGDTWGVAVGYFTCSSNLSIVNGSSYQITNNSGVSSLSASATVVATGTGSGSVTAVTQSASNYNMVDVYPGSATGYVTVSEPANNSSSSSSSSSSSASKKSSSKKSTKTEASDDPQAEKEEQKEEAAKEEEKDAAIEVELNGIKYTLVESKKDIPAGFSSKTFKYGDKKIQGIQSDDKKYTMVKLKPSDGSGKAAWFFFDEQTGSFADSAAMSPSDILAMYESQKSETPVVWVAMTVVLGTLVITLSAFIFKMKKLGVDAIGEFGKRAKIDKIAESTEEPDAGRTAKKDDDNIAPKH